MRPAIRLGNSSAANSSTTAIPLRPFRRLSQESFTLLPTGVTIPRPVITIRRLNARLLRKKSQENMYKEFHTHISCQLPAPVFTDLLFTLRHLGLLRIHHKMTNSDPRPPVRITDAFISLQIFAEKCDKGERNITEPSQVSPNTYSTTTYPC